MKGGLIVAKSGGGGRGGSGGSGAAATATQATATQERSSRGLPDGVSVSESGGTRNYEYQVEGVPMRVEIGDPLFSNANAEITWFVNNSTSTQQGLSDRGSVRAVSTALRIAQADAATRPDGFTYVVQAATRDGRGAERARFYERIGFTRAETPGDSQFAVVRNGRLERYDGSSLGGL